jgi:hypothetical protein
MNTYDNMEQTNSEITEFIEITESSLQTKDWRKEQVWYKTGKSNECEKYQINVIEKIIKQQLNKTDERINTETYELASNRYPMKNDDGYDWTENFDGKIEGNNKFYFNLKFVCDSGGAQTRSLREVYHFIGAQMDYLLKSNEKNTYFINILDGDTSYDAMRYYNFQSNKDKYKDVKKYVFVGSLYDFQNNFQNKYKKIMLMDV